MYKYSEPTHLMAELVAGESQDFQIVAESFLQLVHLEEVLGCRTSEGRRVLHQHNLPLVLVEAHHLT